MSNQVIDCLLNHRSVRKYLQQPVESEKVDLILRAGSRAATGGNLQLYTFVVVDDQALKKRLDDLYPLREFKFADVPLLIFALADLYRTRRWFETNGVPAKDICVSKLYNLLMSNWDSLIALQNMVVAAESLGLGTCYVGNILLMDVQDLFGAPEHVFPAGLVCVGYPDGMPKLSTRLPMEAVVHRNAYHLPSDADMEKFYKERNKVWDSLPEKLREKLRSKGIESIPQGVARRKFCVEDYFISDEAGFSPGVSKVNEAVIKNVRLAGFDLSS